MGRCLRGLGDWVRTYLFLGEERQFIYRYHTSLEIVEVKIEMERIAKESEPHGSAYPALSIRKGFKEGRNENNF